MNTGISFEYYSTFAPVAGAFLAEEPVNLPLDAYKIIKPLRTIDCGYSIYAANKPGTSRSSILKK